MKLALTKYTRRLLKSRRALTCVPTAILCVVASAQAQTPLVGGPGGGEFTARCPPGQILGGVELRVGAWIDAIRPLCRTTRISVQQIPLAPSDPGYKSFPSQYTENVTYPVSEATATPDWNGGPGGHVQTLSCDIGLSPVKMETPSQHYDRVKASGLPDGIDRKVVTGFYIEAEGKTTVTVDRVTLRCEDFDLGQFYKEPSGGFLPPPPLPPKNKSSYETNWTESNYSPTFEAPQDRYPTGESNETRGMTLCPVRQNGAPTVAVGIHGRAGKWLDALGLICEHPVRHPKPVKPAARVKLGPAPVKPESRVKLDPTSAPAAAPSRVCERAQVARARNSPAAPGLEALCRTARAAAAAAAAAGEVASVNSQDRVNSAAPAAAPKAPPPPAAAVPVPVPAVPVPVPVPAVPVAAGPGITASANPVVVPNGQASGTTTITWTAAPDYAYSEIYLSVNDGEWTEFARGADASKQTTIAPGTTQTFRMMIYEGQAGTPKIIATLTVTARN